MVAEQATGVSRTAGIKPAAIKKVASGSRTLYGLRNTSRFFCRLAATEASGVDFRPPHSTNGCSHTILEPT